MIIQLEYKGQRKTAEAWGLSRLMRHTRSEGVETVTFFQVIAETITDPVFDEGEDIKVFLDGVQWFRGTVLRPRRTAEASSKVISFTVANAWNRLERRVFQQQWSGNYTSHLLLNVSSFRQLVSVGAQIGTVIDYVIAQQIAQDGEATLTKGDILPDPGIAETVFPPPNEIMSATCAAVIQNQLRWLLRQGVVFWDYSTAAPTIHIRAPSKLPTVTLDLDVPDVLKNVKSVEIEPRMELRLPGVWITYEFTNTVDGVTSFGLAHDHYPPEITGREEDVLHLTFDMQGIQATNVSQEIETEPIDAAHADEATRLAWWKARVEYLKGEDIGNLEIEAASVVRASNLPRRLTKGDIARWMVNNSGVAVEAQEEVIVAIVSYDVFDASDPNVGRIRRVERKPISCKVTATDAQTGTYYARQTEEAADPIPAGLAEFIYRLNNVTQYQGTVVLKEQALRLPTGQVPRVGARLNINGGREEWATMNAVIQAVDEDVERGETTITLAPVSTMAASDIMEFLRVRRRRRWTNALTQGDGKSRTNEVALPIVAPRDNSVPGEAVSSVAVVKTPAGATTARKIEQNAEDGVFSVSFGGQQSATLNRTDANWTKPFAVRVVCVKVGGQDRVMQVWGSEPY